MTKKLTTQMKGGLEKMPKQNQYFDWINAVETALMRKVDRVIKQQFIENEFS